MKYKTENEFLNYLADYKAGNLPREKEPIHSLTEWLADNLEIAQQIFQSHQLVLDDKLEGFVGLDDLERILAKKQ